MVRSAVATLPGTSCFPHGCGDGPGLIAELRGGVRFSPRVWGWSVQRLRFQQRLIVFPTGVGMVRSRDPRGGRRPGFPHGCGDGPRPARQLCRPSRFPHGCGDGPLIEPFAFTDDAFSPRVWGWSVSPAAAEVDLIVFPTGVGMVRTRLFSMTTARGFPHGCGDGPATESARARAFEFSPRVWGWSDRAAAPRPCV